MVDVLMYISASTAVSLTIGIPEHCQSAINGRKRRNDEMGKAAHMGVGRLLSLADLGNWPHKGVIQMGGSNEFVRPSTSSAGARLHEQRAGVKYADGTGKEVAGVSEERVLPVQEAQADM